VEIDKVALTKLAVEKTEARKNITEYRLADGRRLYLLAEGRLVNLAAGDGHPVEIMDLSFALQILSLLYLKDQAGKLAPGLYPVPPETDRLVAGLALEAFGIRIDTLTASQEKYLNSF